MKLQQANAIETPRRCEIKATKGVWAGLVAAGTLGGSVALVVASLAARAPGLPRNMQAAQAPPVAVSEPANPETQKPATPPGSEPAGIDRKKEIAEESARLLRMATELKSEVDKTTKDTLSMRVIRKAEEIERLAHDVKGNLGPTAKAK
jgi:hypothetical protein